MLWHVHVITVTMDMQKCVCIVDVCHCQQHNKYWRSCHWSTAMHSLYCCTKYVAANFMKHTYVCMKSIVCLILTEPGVARQISVKRPSIKFYGNPSSGSRTCWGRRSICSVFCVRQSLCLNLYSSCVLPSRTAFKYLCAPSGSSVPYARTATASAV